LETINVPPVLAGEETRSLRRVERAEFGNCHETVQQRLIEGSLLSSSITGDVPSVTAWSALVVTLEEKIDR